MAAEAEVLRCSGYCGVSSLLEFCLFCHKGVKGSTRGTGGLVPVCTNPWLHVFRVFWQIVSLQECNCETCAIFYRMQWHKHLNRAGMWLARRIRLSSALCNRVFHRRFSCFIFLQLADCFCKPQYKDRQFPC